MPKLLNILTLAKIFSEQIKRRVKLGLVLAELVQKYTLAVKPERIRTVVDEFAKSYENLKEVVRWYYANKRYLAEIEVYIAESNIINFVLS